MTAAGSTSAASAIERRALLGDVLGKLVQAGFAQKTAPVEGVISMLRAWQGPDEDSAIVDSITIHMRDQALATREGDGVPSWGPMRGPWSDVVDALLALSPPNAFVMVSDHVPSTPVSGLPGGCRDGAR